MSMTKHPATSLPLSLRRDVFDELRSALQVKRRLRDWHSLEIAELQSSKLSPVTLQQSVPGNPACRIWVRYEMKTTLPEQT